MQRIYRDRPERSPPLNQRHNVVELFPKYLTIPYASSRFKHQFIMQQLPMYAYANGSQVVAVLSMNCIDFQVNLHSTGQATLLCNTDSPLESDLME